MVAPGRIERLEPPWYQIGDGGTRAQSVVKVKTLNAGLSNGPECVIPAYVATKCRAERDPCLGLAGLRAVPGPIARLADRHAGLTR
jgi:hypothetical protein